MPTNMCLFLLATDFFPEESLFSFPSQEDRVRIPEDNQAVEELEHLNLRSTTPGILFETKYDF